MTLSFAFIMIPCSSIRYVVLTTPIETFPVLLAVPVFALLGCLIPSIVYGQAARQSIIEQLS